jgi:hypothetical protein
MLGSLTTPDWFATRDDAAPHVAFQVGNPVGIREMRLSRLDGQPARSPADASPGPSRNPTHGLGAM